MTFCLLGKAKLVNAITPQQKLCWLAMDQHRTRPISSHSWKTLKDSTLYPWTATHDPGYLSNSVSLKQNNNKATRISRRLLGMRERVKMVEGE